MKTNHTPGPWEAWRSISEAHAAKVSGPDDLTIVTTSPDLPADAQLANALFIAAAPDMLEALDLLVRWEDGDETVKALEPVMAQARAALAKARGES